MANPAFKLEQSRQYLIRKDTFIFDGNSRSAHMIARSILVNDKQQHFDLIPKQNTAYFGLDLPIEHLSEKFLLITQTGELISGNQALDFISDRIRLEKPLH